MNDFVRAENTILQFETVSVVFASATRTLKAGERRKWGQENLRFLIILWGENGNIAEASLVIVQLTGTAYVCEN